MHSFCLNCGEAVRLYDDNPNPTPWWIHTATDRRDCEQTYAEPGPVLGVARSDVRP